MNDQLPAAIIPSNRLLTADEFHKLAERDLAPKFYPILSSFRRLDVAVWAVVATGAGAEPSA
jgi:hypothetical protein